MIVFLVFALGFVSASLDDGLVSYWEFEDNFEDGVGINDGVDNGGVTFADGKVGRAVDLSGSQFVGYDNPVLGEEEMSICAWVYKDSYRAYAAVISDYGYKHNFMLGHDYDRYARFYVGSDFVQIAGYTEGEWHHLCGVFDGVAGVQSIYLNNEKVTKVPVFKKIGDVQSIYSRIGAYGGFYLDGKIDEIRIWNRALSDEEVEEVYEGVNCVDSDGLNNYLVVGQCVDESGVHYDSCNGNAVQDWKCLNGACVVTAISNCDEWYSGYVCENGACVEGTKCTDSDGGLDYGVKGTTTLRSDVYVDYCNHAGVVSECSGSECYLNEHYCYSDSKVGQKSDIVCPNGCKDGTCVKGEDCKAVTVDYEGFIDCIYNGRNCKSLYDLNGDGVYSAERDATNCFNKYYYGKTTTTICTDTDVGKNYNVIGETVEKNCNGNYCYTSSTDDLCNSQSSLRELFCGSDGKRYGEDYNCPNGCVGGVCISESPGVQCLDSISQIIIIDEDYTYDSNGKIYVQVKRGSKDINIKGIAFVVDSNLVDKKYDVLGVNEERVYVLNGSGSVVEIAPIVEVNGVESVCAISSSVELKKKEASCTDSDGGLNYYVKGSATDLTENEGFTTQIDSCSGNFVLNEISCVSDCEESCILLEPYNCPNGCEDGACVSSTPDCIPRYFCLTEPAICPDSGVQRKRCEDVECGEADYEEEVVCNPGECFGCEFDGKCVPYGFRAKVNLYHDNPGSYNLYCDMSGFFKEQKSVDSSGNWAMCQNNYECESNFCSSGECIEINQMIENVASYKVLGIKILCKLGHLFNVENYNDCVGSRLGKSYVE